MTGWPELGAEEIRSSDPRSFAYGVLTRRHPDLIEAIRRRLPYPPEVQKNLDLLAQTLHGDVPELVTGAHDRGDWDGWSRPYVGRPWIDVPFLWAESYFYRLLLEATGYFGASPWAGIDLFKPQKDAELSSPEGTRDLRSLEPILRAPEEAGLHGALIASLWGNRADLGFRLSSPTAADSEQVDDLVADDSADVWKWLTRRAPGKVDVIADNAGRELLADLVLIDRLLSTERASAITLHLKPHPYYVSDATAHDLLAVLHHMAARSTTAAAEIAARLKTAISNGRLEVQTHAFWCSPLTFHLMPRDLQERLTGSDLVIVKGDLNYRRLVGDRLWAPSLSFVGLTDYFPAPVLALRTLKSDLAVGISTERLARLEAHTPGWRTDGTHAVIQAKL
ncbi:MAG: damage-control phosphatase ARMT1 family protein [Nocardioides sp.]